MALIQKSIIKFSKFLTYVLGRNPDEFGLVPDEQGFIPVKELLKSLHEEEGWRHIRLSHIKEVSLSVTPSPIEIRENSLRASDRSKLPEIKYADPPPKLLYTAVRRRAYPAAIEKGLIAGSRPHLLLSSDREFALRIGKRIDNEPVILTVQVADSMDKGTLFHQYGDRLYLADSISPGTFSGPPLPKEKPVPEKSGKAAEPLKPKTPGSYFPDLSPPDNPKRPRRKEKAWKKDRRNARKHKQKFQR